VVFSLAGLAFHVAAVHAARETICCAYRPLTIIADLLESSPAPLWTLSLFALMGLNIVALYPLIRIFEGIAVRRRTGISVLFVDCIFGVGASIGLYFAWVAAMGHSEPNCVQGFKATWLAVVAISGFALFLTGNRAQKTALRAALWAGGVLIAAVVPALLTSVQSISGEGRALHEQHATSTNYVFAVLVTCLFWSADICLSKPRLGLHRDG